MAGRHRSQASSSATRRALSQHRSAAASPVTDRLRLPSKCTQQRSASEAALLNLKGRPVRVRMEKPGNADAGYEDVGGMISVLNSHIVNKHKIAQTKNEEEQNWKTTFKKVFYRQESKKQNKIKSNPKIPNRRWKQTTNGNHNRYTLWLNRA